MTRVLLRLGTVLTVVIATIGIVLLGQSLGVAHPAPEKLASASGATTRVCPSLRAGGGAGGNLVIDARAAAGEGSEVRMQRIDGTELGVVPGGQVRSVGVEERGTTLARAYGLAAEYAGAATIARTASGPQRGLSLAQCAQPRTESWFVGLRSNAEERASLLLTNADRSVAEVSLVVHTSGGVEPVAGTTGLAIEPGQTRTVALESLLDSPDPLAIQVRATAGRVAAVAEIGAGSGDAPAGADWTPSASGPALSRVIPAVPGGDGSRELIVVNPSRVRNVVRVEALSADGAFPPADAATVELGPGAVGSVELSTALAGEPVAIRLSADQPVTGAVLARSSDDAGRADLALAPAAEPVGVFGVAPVAGWEEHRGQLVVSAVGAAPAGLTWEAFDDRGESLGGGRESVPSGSTRAFEVPEGPQVSVHLAPEPGAELYAGVALAADWEGIATLAQSPVAAIGPTAGEPPRFDPRAG